ncbi:hypothetical protein GGS26DRAFT_603207 [Hypomontagnella submonticulosa]|nr:hypothetical protein GGS26DRAFT_603207 [Hypomontagnella submonticulosa]
MGRSSGRFSLSSAILGLFCVGGSPGRHRRRMRRTQRAARYSPSRPTPPAMVMEAREIRQAQREGIENHRPIKKKKIYRLAELEGVALNWRGRQPPFADGLMARLLRRGNTYWFLGNNCHFYRSSDRHGNNPDLEFVVDTWVPVAVRIFAYPYRQLCHSRLTQT